MSMWRKFTSLFQREKLDTEMSEEMRTHLELQVRENLARGMSPDEARYAAQRSFGGVEQIKERLRDQRGSRWLEQFAQDCRYAARQIHRNPGFSAIVALSLGLGIGANTAIFSLLDAILFRPLPVVAPDELVMFGTQSPGQPGRGIA